MKLQKSRLSLEIDESSNVLTVLYRLRSNVNLHITCSRTYTSPLDLVAVTKNAIEGIKEELKVRENKRKQLEELLNQAYDNS